MTNPTRTAAEVTGRKITKATMDKWKTELRKYEMKQENRKWQIERLKELIAQGESELAGMDSKPEFKVGDEVWVKGTISAHPDMDGDYRIVTTMSSGSKYALYAAPDTVIARTAPTSPVDAEQQAKPYEEITKHLMYAERLLDLVSGYVLDTTEYPVLCDMFQSVMTELPTAPTSPVDAKQESYPTRDIAEATLPETIWRVRNAGFPHIADRLTELTSPVDAEPVGYCLDAYDAGCFSDAGGGDVDWWWDYMRAELGRAHDHYQSQVDQSTHPAPAVEGNLLGWTVERITPEYDDVDKYGAVHRTKEHAEAALYNFYGNDALSKHRVVPVYAGGEESK